MQAFLHSGVAMSVTLMNGQIVDCNEAFEDLVFCRPCVFCGWLRFSSWRVRLFTAPKSEARHQQSLRLHNHTPFVYA